MKTKEIVEGTAGQHVKEFAKELVERRQSVHNGGQDFEATFNGAIITIKANSTVDSIVSDFFGEMDKQAEVYRNSDAFKEQEKRTQSNAGKRVEDWNVLMAKLPKLNFKDHNEVLDWLYNYCETIDYIPALDKEPKMVESRVPVATALINGGYEVNANTGVNFKKDDEENFARYLIGQVLTYLNRNSAVPQVFGTMYDSYQKQFKY